MALTLEIDNADNLGRVNYTRYLAAPDRSPAVLRDRMNLPALFDFSLVPANGQFRPPRRSSYVRLTGLADALPPGGPRVPGPLFTGYITNEPVVEFLGTFQGRAVHGYRCQATSEEYLLNIKRIGQLPPFLNQTAGRILSFLTDYLQPGRFDTLHVADGAFVPSFAVNPDKTWGEVARELAERSGFYYRVLDSQVYFQPVSDQPLGVVVDEKNRHFRPESLEITPLGNPIHNDVTVFGAIEPQTHVRACFVGDGITSKFPLPAPVYGATSARLLADDFSGSAIDRVRWQENDQGNFISLFEGRLNVTGGTGNPGETLLLGTQAMEISGQLEFIHGEFEFVSVSTGILGGLYSSSSLVASNCLWGFDISPIGGTSRIRALVAGAVQAAEVQIQSNHHYILVTKLSTTEAFRTQQTFPGGGLSFGGSTLPAIVRAKLEVWDIDLANPASVAISPLHEATLLGAPSFAFYAPINSTNLHVVANFLQVTQPIQARVETQKPGEQSRIRTLGFGIAAHDATITSDPNQNQWALEFYEDTVPALGERITLTYRAAGRAAARVTDDGSITSEAALAGDNGHREVVLIEVNPQPRTSQEAELAAQAYLADHVVPRFEGRYATWGQFTDSFPRSGRLLEVRCESRHPQFTALVRAVTSEFRELGSERILHTVEFGQASRFEDLLRMLDDSDSTPTVEEREGPMAVNSPDIGTSFLADAPDFSIISFSGSQFLVDMGAPPPVGGIYEIRRSDQGWSTSSTSGTAQNVLATSSSQQFLLPRSGRNQLFYIRPVAPTRETSRFSSLLAIHYPLVPVTPQTLDIRFGEDEREVPIITATIELAEGSIQNVHALELRDANNVTVLARWEFGQLQLEGTIYRARHVIDNSTALARSKTLFAYTQNALGEYSIAVSNTGVLSVPLKPLLTPGNSVGQIIEILLDTMPLPILETQIQVAGPGGAFSSPDQDVVLPGQPEKFAFVATQTGGWAFRARRRDQLGWSPWSDESQGQVGPQVLVYLVQFFRAPELDPSIGAAVNAQNLLPNGEFFLPGIVGQEGTHAARYFGLANALGDGSEIDHLPGSNEIKWKSGVNFAATNPGFRSLLTNLGRLFNPGEALSVSAALRHDGTGGFANAIRFALRSPGTPSYDMTRDIQTGLVIDEYRWFSATFTLPNQSVPGDLSTEISVVAASGQSLSSSLFCDKVILNRGQRPAAFGLAPWDVISLAWNSTAGAYDLPATAAGGTPRTSDPGNAGLLVGTGTEDLDPDFTSRYVRVTN